MKSEKTFRRLLAMSAIAGMSLYAVAAPVSETDARTAAERFACSDPVGSAVFHGGAVVGVREFCGLWIASIEPSGHVVLSGSDLVEPVVCFSPVDFVEPAPGSPAYVVFEKAGKASCAAEAAGTGTRSAKWAALLSGGGRRYLRAGPVATPDVLVVPPFLQSHYDQCQPYNDYCPVYDSSTDATYYRGRTPCGCVATAAAQIMRHFRWPARIDGNASCTHSFTGTNGVETSFPIRFDGHVPIDWNALADSNMAFTVEYVTNYFPNGGYSWHTEPRYDLRDSVAESVRSPVARLILWADVLAQMSFATNSSLASYNTFAAGVSDWYTQGRWVALSDPQVRSDVANGIPVHVSIVERDVAGEYVSGHSVIVNGWAEDAAGETQYAYVNFGWGGSNDGYYNIADDFLDFQQKEAYVGHYPRAKPQLDPLPKVCGPNVTLSWHFPDCYTNQLAGFFVNVHKAATTMTTFFDDFSAPKGTSTAETGSINGGVNDRLYVGTNSEYGPGCGELLCAERFATGTYTFTNEYVLSSASILSFRLRSVYASCYDEYEVQASFDGGAWETVLAPSLTTYGDSGWSTKRVYLGSHGGQTARFRLKVSYQWGAAPYAVTQVLLDDFLVTDVLDQETSETYPVSAMERSFVLPRFEDGATCTFTVTPEISGALAAGEASDPVSVSVAGVRRSLVPGEQLYHMEDLSFSASDTSGTWAYSGTASSDTSVGGAWAAGCSITATSVGPITGTSELSFGWTADEYYGVFQGNDCYDVLAATFTSVGGESRILWCVTNRTARTSVQQVLLPLSSLAGQEGDIVVSYSHVGGGYGSGGALYSPTITNISVPTPPVVEWYEETLNDLGTPSIFSVSPVQEGFYAECECGAVTTFDVECSEHVQNLDAYSSHLALVNERQVTVESLGAHRFRVSVNAANVDAAMARSRMLLTLVATDANGTKAYKDLSLRFVPPVVPLEITTAALPSVTAGEQYSVTLSAAGGVEPYTWSPAMDSVGYNESRTANSFSAVGTAMGWRGDESLWSLSIPFAFPFYGSAYNTIWVSPNGTLSFGGSSNPSYSASVTELAQNVMIAPLWKDLDTTSGDIYVESSADHVTVRWEGRYYNSTVAVSFSATLYSDGTIRFRYGSGNQSGGIVGVSAGDREHFQYFLMSESMANAQDFVLAPMTSLPEGLSLSSTGVLSGVPTSAGVESVVVFVTDHEGTRVGRTFNLTIDAPPATVTTPVAVPHTWLDDYAERFGEDTSGGSATIDYERLANTPTGKHKADGSAMSLWEDFLAGTDPTNSASVFTAKIEVRDGKPVVTWEPDLNENGTKFERVYKVYGRERFGSGSEWEYPTNSLHRFFKISVEMP